MNETLCFCGSGKKYSECHNYIHENSLIAELYKLQNDIDTEIEKQKTDNNLKFNCKPGCCECCSYCYCISEIEFIQIFDFIKHTWSENEIETLINNAAIQWNIIKKDFPEIAEKLQNPVALKELYQLSKIKLPFPCLFLDDNMCSVYKVRPLVCRINGVGYANTIFRNINCSKNNDYFEKQDNYVNLIPFSKRINNLILFNHFNEIIIRRPAPIFYFLHSIKSIDDLYKSELYRNLIGLDKSNYIELLREQLSKE